MTSVADAIKALEDSTPECGPVSEREDVRLCPIMMQMPPIQAMDAALGSRLKRCTHLRLSTNQIAQIAGLDGMDSLQILSLGRNSIRKLHGAALAPVAGTLEQLWLSYNGITSLAGIEMLVNLQVLFMSNNQIEQWEEVERLASLPKLSDLNLLGNPLHSQAKGEGSWRAEVLRRLPNLRTLDGVLVAEAERSLALKGMHSARRPAPQRA